MQRPWIDPVGESRRLRFLGLILLGSAAIGCGVGEVPVVPAEVPAPPEVPAAPPKLPAGPPKSADDHPSVGGSWGPVLKAKIKVKDGSGKDLFSIKPKDDGAKLIGASDQEIARYSLKDDKLKIKDAAEKVLGHVDGKGDKYHLKDSTGKVVLFELQRQADGDWKLEDGKEALVYRIKKRDYGYEIQDHLEVSLARVKTKDGRSEVRDASDHLLYSAASAAVGPLPMACLGLDKAGDRPMRAGLLIRIALEDSSAPTPSDGAKK